MSNVNCVNRKSFDQISTKPYKRLETSDNFIFRVLIYWHLPRTMYEICKTLCKYICYTVFMSFFSVLKQNQCECGITFYIMCALKMYFLWYFSENKRVFPFVFLPYLFVYESRIPCLAVFVRSREGYFFCVCLLFVIFQL